MGGSHKFNSPKAKGLVYTCSKRNYLSLIPSYDFNYICHLLKCIGPDSLRYKLCWPLTQLLAHEMKIKLVLFTFKHNSQGAAIHMPLPLTLLLILTQLGYALSTDKEIFSFFFFFIWPNFPQHTIFSFVETIPLNVELEASALIITAVLAYENYTESKGTCAKLQCLIWQWKYSQLKMNLHDEQLSPYCCTEIAQMSDRKKENVIHLLSWKKASAFFITGGGGGDCVKGSQKLLSFYYF